TWNFLGFYSLEVDFAEREEWFSQNTSTTLAFPAAHSQYNSQKPKVSVRWQPLKPKYIGTVILRATYTEAFHAPTLPELTPAGVSLDGIDYEAIYIFDSTIFGGPDWGRLTFTVNGTYLNRFDLVVNPGSPAINLAGQFVSTSFTITGSLPRDRAYFSLFWDGPADTWLGGIDAGATVHYTGQYHDTVDLDLIHGQGRLVREWITLDLIASYAF